MQNSVDKNKNIKLFDFLGHLIVNFRKSQNAYKNYIDDGRIFMHAKVLKNTNDTIRESLLNNLHLLTDDLLEDASKLIAHYDIWIEKWESLAKKLHSNPQDEFIFHNKHSFPSNSEKNFITKYEEVKKILG